MVRVEQYVMAYRAEHEKIKDLLPKAFSSLRPVLRINAEWIGEGEETYFRIEFNTPVEGRGKRGWWNMATWENRRPEPAAEIEKKWAKLFSEKKQGETFFMAQIAETPFLELTHKRAGVLGGCPAEGDNQGTFFAGRRGELIFREAEVVQEKKEYCDCTFRWNPAAYEEGLLRQAMSIELQEILGAYMVVFEREEG